MMRRIAIGLLLFATGWDRVTAQIAPSARPDVDVAAARTWIGKALFVRGFYGANELTYDATGRVVGGPKAVDWTVAGMDVQAVGRKGPGAIELDGVRVAIRYNPDNRFFERHPQKDEKIKVVVATAPGGVEKALGTVFAVGIDPAMQRAMPECWKHYFDPRLGWPADGLEGQTIYGASGSPPVSAGQMVDAKVLRKADAGFSEEAEKDRVKGTVGLRLVVDASGIARRVTIVRPLGYGLDARAVDAVAKWRFEPAMFQGKPIASTVDLSEEFVLIGVRP